jgi:hypothetical protein
MIQFNYLKKQIIDKPQGFLLFTSIFGFSFGLACLSNPVIDTWWGKGYNTNEVLVIGIFILLLSILGGIKFTFNFIFWKRRHKLNPQRLFHLKIILLIWIILIIVIILNKSKIIIIPGFILGISSAVYLLILFQYKDSFDEMINESDEKNES